METEKRKELEGRRAALRENLKAREFTGRSLLPFIEILEELVKHQVDFQVVKFVNFRPEWEAFIDEALSEAPFEPFGLAGVPRSEGNPLILGLLDAYPSVNPFRYVPDLPLYPCGTSLASIIEEHGDAETVYVSYLRYPFILQLGLAELKKTDESQLFNFWHEDVVIFPKDQKWLMAFSLEDEWRYGRQKQAL